ncbi:MAG: TIGR00725 family protein [Bacteroidales bacterium]|nr:TIGR00725 family protein [Bacteroidales bacterium]
MFYVKEKFVGIIGPGSDICTNEIYEFGLNLGKYLTDHNYLTVCGGKGGIMEAVCKGSKLSGKYIYPNTIGIIPSNDKAEANEYCDIVIPSGIGLARNSIIVNTADLLIAVAGGAGTLSEIAFAWQMNKKVICFTGFEGWAKNLAGKDLDLRNSNLLLSANTLDEIIELIKENI